MTFSTLKPVAFIGKAVLGLAVAVSLSPVAIAQPVSAQMHQSVQTQPSRTFRAPHRSTTPTTPTHPSIIVSPHGDQGPSQADSAGSCNGVGDCNNFIANCIGSGGTYIPETENDEGQPTSGSCDVE